MYGTIACMRIKPGAEAKLQQLSREDEAIDTLGFEFQYVFRLDSDPDEFFLVVAFTDREAYLANAASPNQRKRYERYRALLAAEPEWHDGEIVYASPH